MLQESAHTRIRAPPYSVVGGQRTRFEKCRVEAQTYSAARKGSLRVLRSLGGASPKLISSDIDVRGNELWRSSAEGSEYPQRPFAGCGISLGLYATFFEPGALAAYYTVRGRTYPRVRRLLEHSQWWKPEELRAFQWSELERILRHAFRTVPYYQREYSAAGIKIEDIRTPEDFSKLPPLTRSEVNQHRDELRSTRFFGKLRPHATGGSTGEPTRFYISLDSYDWRSAAW